MPHRRQVLTGMAAAPLAAISHQALSQAASAQPAWQPSHPVQCIIGFAPGGGADLIARAIIEAAQPLIPQPLVVVNRPGAGGTIAAQQVAALGAEGHTLLMGGGSESTSIPAYRTLPYDPKTSFRAVLRLMRQRMFILAKADSRWRSMAEVIAAAKVKPQAVSHGSSGIGSIYHSVFVVLEKRAGVEFLHVPYTGGAPGLQAVAAGQVDLMVASPEEFKGLADGGLLKVLACCSADRAESYPAVPTLTELGWAVEIENMKGWVMPAATPAPAIGYFHDRFRAAMARPGWQAFLERAGDTDGYLDGPGFQRAMDAVLDAITAAKG
ncbi:MAG: tripartite tricarboxylate transporter substrate binding protein [Belnapia sp.]|nr:tripartite tricarboxylate transporter substrate binding protein [Belnapia sp.]